MYELIRSLLFKMDPERVHHLTLRLIGASGRNGLTQAILRSAFGLNDTRLPVEVFGISFSNPIGLAAGYDKDGVAVAGLGALGFGHVEIGTVTCKPQAGNPKPRVWRVPESQALVNSMGFPNAGVDALRINPAGVRIGINIGKGKDTPLEAAAADYVGLLQQVHQLADYVTLNVSSPNTLGLRQLQARSALEELLRAVTLTRDRLSHRLPLLVKIAPDLTPGEIDDVLTVVNATGVDGIIATNTTIGRASAPEWTRNLSGGMSGAPLRARSTEVIRYIAGQTHGKLPIVGVGGIASGADALEKIRAGASLVQVYTGLVYRGPGLVKEILGALVNECKRSGVSSISELVAR